MALESASEFTARPYEYLAEEVDWERNENEKKTKTTTFRYRKAKRTLKLFVNDLLIKKEYFAIL